MSPCEAHFLVPPYAERHQHRKLVQPLAARNASGACLECQDFSTERADVALPQPFVPSLKGLSQPHLRSEKTKASGSWSIHLRRDTFSKPRPNDRQEILRMPSTTRTLLRSCELHSSGL